MKHNFDLEIGTLTNLKGNGVIYWNNKSYSNDIILAINFVISTFPFDKNLVITTFPLSIFETREEFMFYIIQSQCDLIYLGDIELEPLGDTYMLAKSHYKELNDIIESYLEYFRDKIFQKMTHLQPQQKLSLINGWINRLQKDVGVGAAQQDLFKKINNMLTVLNINGISHYDIHEFHNLFYHSSSYRFELMKLYLKKFFAILEEEYEEIAPINSKINVLRKKLMNIS